MSSPSATTTDDTNQRNNNNNHDQKWNEISRQARDSFERASYYARHHLLVVFWYLLGFMTVLIPLCKFWRARATNGDDDEDENNNDNDRDGEENENNNGGGGGGRRWWWPWGGGNNNDRDEDEHDNDDDEEGVPWWYRLFQFGGGGERDGHDDEGSQAGQSAVIFVYVWTLVVFVMLVYLGGRLLHINQERMEREPSRPIPLAGTYALMGFLLLFFNLCFVGCVLLAGAGGVQDRERNGGYIQFGGRAVEQTGWFGQWSVLLFSTMLLWSLYCLGYLLYLQCFYRPNAKFDHGHDNGHNQNHNADAYQKHLDDDYNDDDFGGYGGGGSSRRFGRNRNHPHDSSRSGSNANFDSSQSSNSSYGWKDLWGGFYDMHAGFSSDGKPRRVEIQ